MHSVTTSSNHTLSRTIRQFGGARARRVVDAPGAVIFEHAHDWPVLSVYVAGSLENTTEAGVQTIQQPWAVLYGSRAAHANTVGENGFEQIEIEFDPAWLKLQGIADLRIGSHWVGGPVSRAARELAGHWRKSRRTEAELMDATRRFIAAATRAEQRQAPAWALTALGQLRERPGSTAAEIASAVNLNSDWVAQSYRSTIGEGIRETGRRVRVEKAATMLRTTDLPAADVSAACGFCDQSHMIRCFLRVLGSTPSQIRSEWRSLGGRVWIGDPSTAGPDFDSRRAAVA